MLKYSVRLVMVKAKSQRNSNKKKMTVAQRPLLQLQNRNALKERLKKQKCRSKLKWNELRKIRRKLKRNEDRSKLRKRSDNVWTKIAKSKKRK